MTKQQVVNALYRAEMALNEIQDNGDIMGALNLSSEMVDQNVAGALKRIEAILHAIEGKK